MKAVWGVCKNVVIIVALTAFGGCCYYLDYLRFYR